MPKQPTVLYAVYKLFEDNTLEFLKCTKAVSDRQAVNNVRWSIFGETPEGALGFDLVAYPTKSEENFQIMRILNKVMAHHENERMGEVSHSAQPTSSPVKPRRVEMVQLEMKFVW